MAPTKQFLPPFGRWLLELVLWFMGSSQGDWCLIQWIEKTFHLTHECCHCHYVTRHLRLWHNCPLALSPVTNTVISPFLLSGLSEFIIPLVIIWSQLHSVKPAPWYVLVAASAKEAWARLSWRKLKAFSTGASWVLSVLMPTVTSKRALVYQVPKTCLNVGLQHSNNG